jgi:hypothetical protein
MAVWYSLCSFGILFPILVFLDQEKSGIPEPDHESSSPRLLPTRSQKKFSLFIPKLVLLFSVDALIDFKKSGGLASGLDGGCFKIDLEIFN